MRYDAWIMYIERNKKPGTFRVYQAFVDEILCFPPVIRHPACDSSGDIVAVGGEEVYVLAVDKAGFDEDGGHGGLAQDAEGGMGFYAAVFVVWVKGGEGGPSDRCPRLRIRGNRRYRCRRLPNFR